MDDPNMVTTNTGCSKEAFPCRTEFQKEKSI